MRGIKNIDIKKWLLCITAVALFMFFIPADISHAEPGDLGEPYGSYDMGSAKILSGRNVIISYFADSYYGSWTEDEIKDSLLKLDIACSYLEECAHDNGIDLSFIYASADDDTSGGGDLVKKGSMKVPLDDEDLLFLKLDRRIRYMLDHETDYDSYLDMYDAEGVLTVIFFKDRGRSFAITYDGRDFEEETLILFSDSSAAALAHELLHLFGAHDYYKGAEYTDECVGYITKNYPDEIMLSISEGQDDERISEKISRITAYHIGWIDEIPDTAEYPELTR